jgi:hypothetical protein
MFKKAVIKHQPETEHLISKLPRQSFKKNQMISVPQGYEAILMERDGSVEVLKNQLQIKIEQPIEYIYFAKSNRKIMRCNWGTPTRIQVETSSGKKGLGGYGYVEFQLVNPVRFINTRMEDDEYADEALLTKLVLARIPDLLHQVLPQLEPVDTTNESKLILALKEALNPNLKEALDALGIGLQSLVIENLNFQSQQGGE